MSSNILRDKLVTLREDSLAENNRLKRVLEHDFNEIDHKYVCLIDELELAGKELKHAQEKLELANINAARFIGGSSYYCTIRFSLCYNQQTIPSPVIAFSINRRRHRSPINRSNTHALQS